MLRLAAISKIGSRSAHFIPADHSAKSAGTSCTLQRFASARLKRLENVEREGVTPGVKGQVEECRRCSDHQGGN